MINHGRRRRSIDFYILISYLPYTSRFKWRYIFKVLSTSTIFWYIRAIYNPIISFFFFLNEWMNSGLNINVWGNTTNTGEKMTFHNNKHLDGPLTFVRFEHVYYISILLNRLFINCVTVSPFIKIRCCMFDHIPYVTCICCLNFCCCCFFFI